MDYLSILVGSQDICINIDELLQLQDKEQDKKQVDECLQDLKNGRITLDERAIPISIKLIIIENDKTTLEFENWLDNFRKSKINITRCGQKDLEESSSKYQYMTAEDFLNFLKWAAKNITFHKI